MTSPDITTVIVTVLTVLTSSAAWKFWERRAEKRERDKQQIRKDATLYRDDLKERIVKLETLLTEAGKDKDEMRHTIIELTSQVSKLQVEVEFMRKENELLRQENQFLREKI